MHLRSHSQVYSVLRALALCAVIAVPAVAAEPEEIRNARKLVQDYEQSERLRTASELVSAHQLVTEHESGKKKAEPTQLAAAREIVRKNEERKAAAREQQIEDTPILVILLREGPGVDLPRLFDAANRELFKSRIAEAKAHIDGNEERFTVRSRQELAFMEKAFSDLKPTGKILGGYAVTVFEESDCFVVAYHETSRTSHFVCSLSKVDYSRLPREVRRYAFNPSQKTVTLD